MEGLEAHRHVPSVGEDDEGIEEEAQKDRIEAFEVAVLKEAVPHEKEDQGLGEGAGPLGPEKPLIGAVGQPPLQEGGQEEGPGRLELYPSEVLEPGSQGEGEAESEECGEEVEGDTDPSFAAR